MMKLLAFIIILLIQSVGFIFYCRDFDEQFLNPLYEEDEE